MSDTATKRARECDEDVVDEDSSDLVNDEQQSSDINRFTVVGGVKSHAPSKVVHIRNMNDTVTEVDVKRDLLRFGNIKKTLFMYKKRQALVEYDDLQSAMRCVNEASKYTVRIGGTPAYINYSPYNNLTKHE